MKKIIIGVIVSALLCFAAACSSDGGSTISLNESPTGHTASSEQEPAQTPQGEITSAETPPVETPRTWSGTTEPPPDDPRPDTLAEQRERTIHATITMEDGGVIVVELYPDLAPQSVRNFVFLAREGYYDGLKFHRIIKGFMIQGGCPNGDGFGNPGYSIKGEFNSNGFQNGLNHVAGVLSMARSGDPDSAGSQFFIIHETSPHLNGDYAAFGLVINGMDVVNLLADTPVIDSNGTVADENKPVIKSITIDDDIELPEPHRLAR